MLVIVSGLLIWTSLPKIQRLVTTGNVSPDLTEQYEELPFAGSRHARSCLCPRTPTGQRLCSTYPPAAIKRSQLVSSTNARMKTVLAKFMRERESGSMRRLKVGIMGGSVSACHGVAEDGDSMGKECYARIVGDWLDERLGGGEAGWGKMVEVKNGAIGGMDASYYAFCGMNHLHDDVDIVILEFDVNDQANREYAVYFDQLVRIVLSWSSSPAVIILGTWGPLIAHDLGSLTPMWAHLPVAHYYDIPYLSIHPMLWPTFLRFPHSVAETFFHPDGFHPTAEGQRLLADIVVAHLESVFCEMDRDAWDEKHGLSEWTKEETWVGGGSLTVNSASTFKSLVAEKNFPALIPGEPSLSATAYEFLSLPNTTSVQPIALPHPLDTILDVSEPDPESWEDFYSAKSKVPRPFCADANSKVQPFKPKHNTGWKTMVWKNEKHFWVSDTVGAEISVDIKVNEGRVAVFYFRSEKLSPGTADCWVDDNEKGAKRLQGHWPHHQNVPSVSYIDAEVTPGNHLYVQAVLSRPIPVEAGSHRYCLGCRPPELS
ncbi:hypothetical protein M407DRAFT_167269 [Tulasnella calospora MUT 4182]|uniref:SGNH hydrolase-type esterase domain-containing protein n=1 Tax=Tulasnella calospora MUT 4182 TaxID=1051891 RepID=A0A0C3M7B7_9AGAM|nr:hypothetical protein M407DRAFT_167269 [Tulasnella calospora MUT 4182]